MSVTIRLRPNTHQALRRLADATGVSMQEAMEKAVEERERQLYLEQLNADYAALQQDPRAAAEFREEVELWDATSGDGLEGI